MENNKKKMRMIRTEQIKKRLFRLIGILCAMVAVYGILAFHFGLPFPIHKFTIWGEKGYFVCSNEYLRIYSGKVLGRHKLQAVAHDGPFSSLCFNDIDDDNVSEIINICRFGSLVHKDVYIYKKIDGITYIGTINPAKLLLPGLCYKNDNSINVEYDSIINDIVVKYKTSYEEDQWAIKQLSDLTSFDFVKWDSHTPLKDYAPDFSIYSKL